MTRFFHHSTNASNMYPVSFLRSKYGNNGYAFWFKLLEFAGNELPYRELAVSDEDVEDRFSEAIGMEAETYSCMIDDLAHLGFVHEQLWFDEGVVRLDSSVVFCED